MGIMILLALISLLLLCLGAQYTLKGTTYIDWFSPS